MNGRKISAALTALPEDMVAEAMEPGWSGQSFSWLRLAACLAIIVGLCFGFWPADSEIVTAPGLLTVTVYAMHEETLLEAIILDDGVDFLYSQKWHPGINIVPGLPISLDYATLNNTVYLDITVDGGSVFRSEISQALGFPDQSEYHEIEVQTQFTSKNPVTIYWKAYAVLDDGSYLPAEDTSYLDIVIYEGDAITGYAVIMIQKTYDVSSNLANGYYAALLESRYFPCVDGKYQDVTEEYVRSIIEEVKRG